jgi:hypothetical protein
MASGDLLIFAGFAIAVGAFVVVLFLYIRSRYYVAKDKLHAVEDVSQLWKYGVPPKIALNEKGLRLRRYGNVSLVIFLIVAGVIGVVSNFGASSRFNVWSATITTIFYGSFLAGMFIESRLKHHVSGENVRAVEDLARLWALGGAPKIVLNEKGLRQYRYMRMAATVFFVGMGIVIFGAIFGNDMPLM